MLAIDSRTYPRRQWIRQILSVAAVFQTTRFSLGEDQDPATPAQPLSFRIRSLTELSGEVHLKAQNTPSIRKDGKPTIARKAPVESKSTLDYDQQYILGSDDESIRGYMYYHEAHSQITIDRHTTQTVLRENCKEVVKRSTGRGIHPAALANPLFSAERDLINGAIDSIYIDQLLTEKEVAISDRWTVDRVAAARLLHLDAILEGNLSVCLVDTDDDKAHLEISGKLQASARDVSTELMIQGKALMDRKGGYVSWLALQIDETRDIGEAEPGFKITAQVKILRAPIESMSSGRTLAQAWEDAPSPASTEILQFQSDLGFYRFLADCRWSTYRDNGEEATLRYVVNNRRVAQCNITNLVDFQPGEQLTIEGYQADLERLASRTGREILEATEQLTNSKHRMLRIVMSGAVEGVPLRWIHYHISNDFGRRLSLVFTTDETSLDVFGQQDSQIIDSLELLAWPEKIDRNTLESTSAEPSQATSNSQPLESASAPGATKK